MLDWLARNVHDWEHVMGTLRVSKGTPEFFSAREEDGVLKFTGATTPTVTRQQWLDRRAELQNKPSFADHPDAKCFVQQDDGIWFKQVGPEQRVSPGTEGGWRGDGSKTVKWVELAEGEVLGDWRYTLERRPAEQASPQAAAEFEPFTSREDSQSMGEDKHAPEPLNLSTLHTIHHAAFLHQGCQLLLSEPELVVFRTADGELIHCKPKECLIDPDVYGLAARLLADMSGHPVAPEHMREVAEQMNWRVE